MTGHPPILLVQLFLLFDLPIPTRKKMLLFFFFYYNCLYLLRLDFVLDWDYDFSTK